ncbi:uncharacterized protein LOC141837300 [Curcuma longa]|uniref:uncharacterized protein LOC141837300 n=1 Tax=Curcuma longa TaxID=136217 RepID=UPI003D9F1842
MGICRGRKRPPLLLCLALVLSLPLFLSVSRLYQNPPIQVELERSRPKKSDHLVLGPAAGVGLPNRLQCQGLKAINKLHSLKSNQDVQIGDRVSFVIVYTVYNNSYGSNLARMDDKLADIVTVGSNFYNKVERSMAILNAFIDFIQKSAGVSAK